MLTIEAINNIRAFMRRAQMNGNEVDAFNRCFFELAQEENMAVQKAKLIAEAKAAAEAQIESQQE